MAAELVGGAFLSASVQLLFQKIDDYLTGKKSFGLDVLLKKLKIKLSSVSAVLDDAEYKQIRNRGVKDWLDELQGAVFDAEDLLADIEADALQHKMESESRTGLSKVSNFLSSIYDPTERERKAKIEEILERLEYITSQKDILGLKEGVGKISSWRLPSTSLVEESGVYGRDEDKDVIINKLLSNDEGSCKIGVIPIVGMGGLGKTTLAQLVYNDDQVKKHFEMMAWVCVSEEFDVSQVTKTVLQSISSISTNDVLDLNSLQVQLKERLTGRKFLIVLDDVWNENYVDWEDMRKPFIEGAQGSKIIVTTRSKKVASIMGTSTISSHHLGELSNEASWELFAKHAFVIGDFTAHQELERIGREIIKKCKGLPLALKTLGGMLRSTLVVGEWEKILKSDIWDLTDEQSKILPALRLSYYYLPSPLKRCFAYCSIFPKDFEFEKEDLILLWMAENLLEQPKRSKRMEDVGDEYFNDLVSRSFFQRGKYGDSSFIMHDLIVDLAKFVSGRYHFLLDGNNPNEIELMKQARHLTCFMGRGTLSQFPNYVSEIITLRTLFAINGYTSHKKVVNDWFLKVRCLRALSLASCKIEELLNSIDELRHLRYLDLSYNFIKTLPESFCKLYSLQTLKVVGCSRLTYLPKDFHHLINLRYLDVSDCGLERMPTQMGKLKSLQKLSTFIVEKERTNIGELGELADLIGRLQIRNLHNIIKAEDAFAARLRDKNLKELELEWAYDYETDDTEHERAVLDNLPPKTNLEVLRIGNYGGTKFPNWLGDESFHNMMHVYLSDCKYCYSLPPLGQLPSLKYLEIERFESTVRVGPEFCGNNSSGLTPFASLETLKFVDMSNWEEWLIPDGAFPKLKTLSLLECKKLTGGLPCFLPYLTEFSIDGCPQLASSLPMMPIVSSVVLKNCRDIAGCHVLESYWCLEHLSISKPLDSTTCRSLPVSLERLEFWSCKKLEFPLLHSYDCLNLTQLWIYKCDNVVTSGISWNLQGLPNLKTFGIYDCTFENNLESFPEEGLLPSNITKLRIGNLEWLKTLDSNGLQQLTSLTSLSIYFCPNLQTITEKGLPSSLEEFELVRCPLMKAKCEREKGEYWNKIAHIPTRYI